MLDGGCNYKRKAGSTYILEVGRAGEVSNHSCDYKTREKTTYGLEVEREGHVLGCPCYYKQGHGRTHWRWREGNRSDHNCDCK